MRLLFAFHVSLYLSLCSPCITLTFCIFLFTHGFIANSQQMGGNEESGWHAIQHVELPLVKDKCEPSKLCNSYIGLYIKNHRKY